jgi:hypothetical protein
MNTKSGTNFHIMSSVAYRYCFMQRAVFNFSKITDVFVFNLIVNVLFTP